MASDMLAIEIMLGIITTILSGVCLHYLTKGRSKCSMDSHPTPIPSPRVDVAVEPTQPTSMYPYYVPFDPPTNIMGVIPTTTKN